MSNYEIRADLLEDFLLNGGGITERKLTAQYYAQVDQELASLESMAFDVPSPALPERGMANSISKSSVKFVGFASRTFVLSSLRLRVHE